ncbi:DNA double-strand break repair nuclease NurA [Caldivirga sp. UBA161]|uniref:DNA double-strand break repair nuclease NurA n=1 Tax=Caldivirga sp. UBA161 TaxID=1915569 RepID=UPI0025C266E6|nr:DNA double-strand break repair nuclease NurA [Caldivirga sp. UBA161]
MYTLESLISGVYKLSEVELTQISAELGNLNIKDIIIEVNSNANNYSTAAVDSGFIPVKYLGVIVGLINVATVVLPSNARSRFIVRVVDNLEALEDIAKLEEFNSAVDLLKDYELVLMDGPLVFNDNEPSRLSAVINRALSTGHYVLSFTKEVRINRISSKLMSIEKQVNEVALFFTLFERFRENGSRSVLITTPVNVRSGVVGFYMQANAGSPPVYVEASENVVRNPEVLGAVSLMMSRENYPIPLYVADKLSKVSDEVKRWFIMALLRIGERGEVDPLLYRYIRDVLGYARGRSLY